MPLPTDEKLIALSEALLKQFETIFGLHPGFRPAHARGTLVTGTFTPSPEAKELSKAPHLLRESTPVTVRFSNSTGIPMMPDNSPDANPRGMAVRFHLAEHVHTDIVAHSKDGFPTRTGEEFLEFLGAVAGSGPDVPSPKPVEVFLGSHPAALAYVQAPKPSPVSFATEGFFGVTAMEFINQAGVHRFGRYRIVPSAGLEHFNDEKASTKDADYLFSELGKRIAAGPVRFEVKAQLAQPVGDPVDDATIHWPEDREVMTLGRLELTAMVPDDAEEQRKIIFDPIPRVEGIEPSEDPLLELRAAVYLISGRRRRAAQAGG